MSGHSDVDRSRGDLAWTGVPAEPVTGHEGKSSARLLVITLVIVFVVSLAVLTSAWFASTGRPSQVSPGWFSFSDQSSYLREAKVLAAGAFPSRAQYVYGVGYPLVAVPALTLGETRDPFAPFNALAFAVSMVMVTVVGARIRSVVFGLVCTALLMFATPVIDVTYIPWSSTVTLLVVSTVLFLATGPRSSRAALLVGLGAGWCLAARYIDGLWPLLMTLGTFLRRAREIAVALTAVAVIGGAVLFSQWAVFGSPFITPYKSHVEPNGLGGSDQDPGAYDVTQVPVRFVGMMTGYEDGRRWPGEPLGQRFFWSLLAPLGLWFLYRDRHPLRLVLAAAFATSCVALIFYLSFRASGAGMLQFGGLHYFKAWFPLWALLAAYGSLRLLEQGQVRWPARVTAGTAR